MNNCDKNCTKHCQMEAVLRYLAQQISPVVFGVKPAMLVGLHCWDKLECCPTFFEYKQDVLALFGVKARIFSETSVMTQVYFYREDLLQNALNDSLAQQILQQHGYASFNAEETLDEIQSRFDVKEMPHEIGLFLGYPSKDVFGYIAGHEPSKEVSSPWRIYGEEIHSSVALMVKHDNARRAMNLMLERYESVHHCLEKIHRVVLAA